MTWAYSPVLLQNLLKDERRERCMMTYIVAHQWNAHCWFISTEWWLSMDIVKEFNPWTEQWLTLFYLIWLGLVWLMCRCNSIAVWHCMFEWGYMMEQFLTSWLYLFGVMVEKKVAFFKCLFCFNSLWHYWHVLHAFVVLITYSSYLLWSRDQGNALCSLVISKHVMPVARVS